MSKRRKSKATTANRTENSINPDTLNKLDLALEDFSDELDFGDYTAEITVDDYDDLHLGRFNERKVRKSVWKGADRIEKKIAPLMAATDEQLKASIKKLHLREVKVKQVRKALTELSRLIAFARKTVETAEHMWGKGNK